jgi:hypothetical protein
MTWHISFQQTPCLPEQLLAGREAIYLRHFLDSGLSAMRMSHATHGHTPLPNICVRRWSLSGLSGE